MFEIGSHAWYEVTQDTLKIYIDKALKLRFKSLCALQDKDMSKVASELIAVWVRQNDPSFQASDQQDDEVDGTSG